MPSTDDLSQRIASIEISSNDSPALSQRIVPSIHSLDLDLTLSTAVSHLINHLLQPITRSYPSTIVSDLRLRLTNSLTELYAPSWNPLQPQYGSGLRSLICTKLKGLPKVLSEAAKEVGVDEEVWKKALNKSPEEDPEGRLKDEWEAWCDPGTVVWRYGGWEWEDPEFDPFKAVKGKFQIVWSSSSSPKPAPPTVNSVSTPAKTSYAIPIRAPVPLPAVFAIPPTPAAPSTITVAKPSSPLLPPASISRTPSPSPSDSSYASSRNQSRSCSMPTGSSSRGSHRGTGSTSSNGSSESEQSSQQLLTPQTRPPSVDPFTSEKSSKSVTPTQRGRTSPVPTPMPSSATPTVTPYDGGNVTVLGGGVKLGGISRPSSVMSNGRNGDRSRSPSVSLASRALSSALGPNGQPATRKTRTRRRIMPTYLGHLQPGVGGPMGTSFVPAIQSGWQGVGVGVAPPPIPAMSRPLGQLRVSSI